MELFRTLADFVVYQLLGLSAESKLGAALHFYVEDVTKIFVLLSLIIFAIGLLRASLTEAKIRQLVGGNSPWRAYPTAVGLGAISPFCSCSSVPLFMGFLEAGIPLGVTMAFLITSPMINEMAVIILFSTVGWQITTAYVAVGLTVGLLGGLIIAKLKMEKYIEMAPPKTKCCSNPKPQVIQIAMPGSASGHRVVETQPPSPWAYRITFAKQQVKDILQRVWLYVLIGIGIGAIIHGYVPQSFFLQYASADNLFAVPMAILAGIPLYSDAVGIIPVIEALLAKGLPMGTALALMMSIAAISLPELIILRKVVRWPVLAVFVLWLFFAFNVVGYLFNGWAQ
uniref:Putative Permease n=1 Tax=Magnetococcus massalia (strain MO-1) TaxID=451514 RepID=A0A1S7LK29_MAGMO|nr:putative Permease [Candidatus Magnetococcus massalia]